MAARGATSVFFCRGTGEFRRIFSLCFRGVAKKLGGGMKLVMDKSKTDFVENGARLGERENFGIF